jgi:hypothetical protein
MRTPIAARYSGYRFPTEIISHAVWTYFRFPLSLRMVEELLAARGILVSHESVQQWALNFGQQFANQIRRRLPLAGDKWHVDEVVLKIAGVTHWLWRAVDRQHKGLNNGAENLHQPTHRREAVQVSRPGTAFRFCPRPDQQPLPSPSRSHHRRRAPRCQNARFPGLGGNQQRYRSGIIIAARRLAMTYPLITPSQVDSAVPGGSGAGRKILEGQQERKGCPEWSAVPRRAGRERPATRQRSTPQHRDFFVGH